MSSIIVPLVPGVARTDQRILRIALAALTTMVVLGVLPGAALGGTAVTFSSGDQALAIPDDAVLEHSITVPQAGEVLSVRVSVNVGHLQDDQLNFDLVHPDGTVVRLSHDNGGLGNNYGSGSDCSGGFTVFADEASTPITAGSPPFLGAFRPEGELADLSRRDTNGAWKLLIRDDTPGVVGVLWCWRLTITFAEADLGVSSIGTPDPASVGSELVYTNVVTNNGPDASLDVELIDSLPAEVSFTGYQATGGTCTGAQIVVCELGTLDAGASATVTIIVTPTRPGTATNRVTVAGTPEPLNDAGSNIAVATTTITGEPSRDDRSCTIVGTSGDDILVGTTGNDVICALGGNDRVFAGGGNDVVFGDAGNDVLHGEGGNDVLRGGSGRDRLLGGDGTDELLGGGNADRLLGGSGADRLLGHGGNDRLVGDAGADSLNGGRGQDLLKGGRGRDLLLAKDGKRDIVRGGPNRDRARLDGVDKRFSIETVL